MGGVGRRGGKWDQNAAGKLAREESRFGEVRQVPILKWLVRAQPRAVEDKAGSLSSGAPRARAVKRQVGQVGRDKRVKNRRRLSMEVPTRGRGTAPAVEGTDA